MHLSRRLPKLKARLKALGLLIDNASRSTDTPTLYAGERAIIQLQVEWEHFVRGVILDSATGEFSDANGTVYSKLFPRLTSREAAAHKLISLYPKRTYEPDWYLPLEAIDAAKRLDLSNFNDISAELGQTPWPIDELRHLRNFIAHRSKRSALALRGTGLLNHNASIQIVQIANSYDSTGSKRYRSWINFMQGSARRLV